jgi:uncharacterized tellurite resistance protein B-like protein
MLSRLRQFIEDVISPASGRTELSFDDNGYRLAAAALLVHVISLDGEPSAVERRKLQLLLEDRFNLDAVSANKLITLATRAESDAVDLYQFTSVLMRTVNEEGRLRIIEMMWEVVYADGHVSEFEENVVWRAADLLAVSARDRINLKRRAAFDLQSGALHEPIDDAAN